MCKECKLCILQVNKTHKMTIQKGKAIRYIPTKENRDFLLEEQIKKNRKESYLGLNRIVDLIVTKVRKEDKGEA